MRADTGRSLSGGVPRSGAASSGATADPEGGGVLAGGAGHGCPSGHPWHRFTRARHLPLANFDPEFYSRHERDIVKKFRREG